MKKKTVSVHDGIIKIHQQNLAKLAPKQAPPSEWKQGFLVVPAVDIFKPDTIRQTLEWFNGQTGRN